MILNVRHIFVAAVIAVVILLVQSIWRGRTEVLDVPQDRPADDVAFEAAQTSKLLGVPVQNFRAPQGLKSFDIIPATAQLFRFTLTSRPVSGPPPRVSYHERKIV